MFSIMVWLWCWGFTRFKAHNKVLERWFLYIAVLWCGYGIGMEFVQRYLVINRSFDMGDIVADSVGCLMGWWYSSRRYIKK